MNILYYSDIHIEIWQRRDEVSWTDIAPLGYGPDLSAYVRSIDLLILAGDIGRVRSTRNVSPLRYAEQAAAYLGCPAVLVPGNHEYYRGVFDEDRAGLLAANVAQVTVIDRGEAFYSSAHGRLRILGATLWTDYAALGDARQGMVEAGLRLEDHRLINRHDGTAFLPQDALDQHRLSRSWLAEKLDAAHDGPTLIVTHHAPHSAARHPNFANSPLSPAFYSNCDDLIAAAGAARISAWIFGHNHWCQRTEVAGVTLLSAQRGYPGEQTGWDGPRILAI